MKERGERGGGKAGSREEEAGKREKAVNYIDQVGKKEN